MPRRASLDTLSDSVTCSEDVLESFEDINEMSMISRKCAYERFTVISGILPFITDTQENILGILQACRDTGVKGIIQYGMGLTLRDGNREYFYAALDKHFPGLKERYIRLYGNAYELPSPKNDELMALFHGFCEYYGIWHDNQKIFTYLHELETDACHQLSFFGGEAG